MKAKKKVEGHYPGPVSPVLSASLTHCLHSNADCTHTHTRMDSLSSPGHDSVPSDSSECAALTSLDSTVCHAVPTSVCAVWEVDCSQISSALQQEPSICFMYFAVRGRHYRPQLYRFFPGNWVETLHGFNRCSSTPLTYFSVSMLCALVCPHAHMYMPMCLHGVCEHLPLKNRLLQRDTGSGERLVIFLKWNRRLTSFAQVLTHPRTADTSSHTAAGKQSAIETQSRFLWWGRWVAVRGRVAAL